MGVIITGNRRTEVLNAAKKPPPDKRHWKSKDYRIGKGPLLRVYGPERIKTADANIAAIRTHFGVNVTNALIIAVQLTATAIRRNKAHVELPK